jgi:hypothetical protein
MEYSRTLWLGKSGHESLGHAGPRLRLAGAQTLRQLDGAGEDEGAGSLLRGAGFIAAAGAQCALHQPSESWCMALRLPPSAGVHWALAALTLLYRGRAAERRASSQVYNRYGIYLVLAYLQCRRKFRHVNLVNHCSNPQITST